jgi:predicted O-methyltransferase YrrM
VNDIAEFSRRVSTLPFQGTSKHAWLVYGLVRWLHPEVVLETGTWQGYVTSHIALGLMHNGHGKVYSIENFAYQDISNPEQIINNLSRIGVYGPHVEIIAGNSLEVSWPERISLAVLDGDRSLPNFRDEVHRVIDCGAVCFCVHDTHHDGNAHWYMKQFREKMLPEWNVIDPAFDGGFAVAMKALPGHLTGWEPEADSPLRQMRLP